MVTVELSPHSEIVTIETRIDKAKTRRWWAMVTVVTVMLVTLSKIEKIFAIVPSTAAQQSLFLFWRVYGKQSSPPSPSAKSALNPHK
jgi:hypothetical protein